MTETVFLLNGPNLNLLGQREPHLYGADSLDDAVARARAALPEGFALDAMQSNHEGALVDRIQEARGAACGIVINPGAYSHTSIAILDALNAFEGPVAEVHVTNVHAREAFRRHSYVSLRADAVVAGLGIEGYAVGVRFVCAKA